MQYFFQATLDAGVMARPYALVSLFSTEDGPLLKESKGALVVCKYLALEDLKVIPTSSILSVVGMVPYPAGADTDFFLVEKLGLDMAHLGGHDEPILEE